MATPHEQFVAIELTAIDAFVADARQEDLHLDFKLFASPPELSKDDKKNLAKALSGFANSDGGLIVWGVDARKNADGVDAAVAKAPIPRIDAVLSRLNSLTGEAVSPIVDGVEHRVVKAPGADDGFIVTIVPHSDSGPHMAKLGEDRYYKRSGDSFYRLEHFDLEDMFGRRPKPKLEIATHPESGPSSLAGTEFYITIGIRNTGRGVARFPFLKLIVDAPYRIDESGLLHDATHGLKRRSLFSALRPPDAFYGGVDDVVHPGDELFVTRIAAKGPELTKPPAARFTHWCGAESVPEKGGSTIVTVAEILAAVLR